MAKGIVVLRLLKDRTGKAADQQAAILNAYFKEGDLIGCAQSDKHDVYQFQVRPAKAKKHKPLGYIPVNSMSVKSVHKPYYSWRVDTAEACTCRKRERVNGTAKTCPHAGSYSTNSWDHTPNCKSQAVIKRGGFA